MGYLQSHKQLLINKGYTEAEAKDIMATDDRYRCPNCGELSNMLNTGHIDLKSKFTKFLCYGIKSPANKEKNELIKWLKT